MGSIFEETSRSSWLPTGLKPLTLHSFVPGGLTVRLSSLFLMKRRIFTIHTSRMTLADDVNFEYIVMAKDDLSGADIKAICTEAGLMAFRERRIKVTNQDFKK